MAGDIEYKVSPSVSDEALNELFACAWDNHEVSDLASVLAHSLGYVCGYQEGRLIGFVNVVWDGGVHAFLLDPTVHPELRRRGIGVELVRHATALAREARCQWLHVDYESRLAKFYQECGFLPCPAGLIRLRD